MTAEEFKAIRAGKGWSARKLSEFARLGCGSVVRKIEAGKRGINGPLSLVMELLRDGVIGDAKGD